MQIIKAETPSQTLLKTSYPFEFYTYIQIDMPLCFRVPC